MEFDFLITAGMLKTYKPNVSHFENAVEVAGVEPKQNLHVAASLFVDMEPAGKMGF